MLSILFLSAGEVTIPVAEAQRTGGSLGGRARGGGGGGGGSAWGSSPSSSWSSSDSSSASDSDLNDEGGVATGPVDLRGLVIAGVAGVLLLGLVVVLGFVGRVVVGRAARSRASMIHLSLAIDPEAWEFMQSELTSVLGENDLNTADGLGEAATRALMAVGAEDCLAAAVRTMGPAKPDEIAEAFGAWVRQARALEGRGPQSAEAPGAIVLVQLLLASHATLPSLRNYSVDALHDLLRLLAGYHVTAFEIVWSETPWTPDERRAAGLELRRLAGAAS